MGGGKARLHYLQLWFIVCKGDPRLNYSLLPTLAWATAFMWCNKGGVIYSSACPSSSQLSPYLYTAPPSSDRSPRGGLYLRSLASSIIWFFTVVVRKYALRLIWQHFAEKFQETYQDLYHRLIACEFRQKGYEEEKPPEYVRRVQRLYGVFLNSANRDGGGGMRHAPYLSIAQSRGHSSHSRVR